MVGFALVAFLTALAIGLPALWLINRQFERQAWAQVAQGIRASQALNADRQSEVRSLSDLTAQRPTIRNLLSSQELQALPEYLGTLQQATDLDAIVICSPEGSPLAFTVDWPAREACSLTDGAGYLASRPPHQHPVLLYARSEIEGADASLGWVLVGLYLDDEYAAMLKAGTGLDQTVYLSGQPVASSFPSGTLPGASGAEGGIVELNGTDLVGRRYRMAGTPYFAGRFPLDGQWLESEVALDVSDMVETRRVLIWGFAAGMMAVALVGSLLGFRVSRRINSSLIEMTKAAERLSRGNLNSPVRVEEHFQELSVVAEALEGARKDLRRTLSQLQHAKAWSEDLLSAIVEGIVTLDAERKILFFSPGAERITGWGQEEVLGRPCDEVFLLADREEPFSRAIASRPTAKRLSIRLRSGQAATLAFTEAEMAPSEVGRSELVLVFRDVSEEEALHRLLGNFLANVAHEFRTPLSSLAASAELLVDQAEELSPEELRELLGSLHLGALRLQTLVDNLLESASMEAGQFRVYPRPTDLAEVIGEAAHWMEPLLAKRGQRLVLDLPSELPVVLVDPRRTVQILVNLLSNADKFSPDGSQIFLAVQPQDGWVRVSVTDEGPGIDPENREIVFRRFSNIERSDPGSQYGAGLGLSVVKTIVEAFGGEVGVEGQDGGGATFWLTLPTYTEP